MLYLVDDVIHVQVIQNRVANDTFHGFTTHRGEEGYWSIVCWSSFIAFLIDLAASQSIGSIYLFDKIVYRLLVGLEL